MVIGDVQQMKNKQMFKTGFYYFSSFIIAWSQFEIKLSEFIIIKGQ